MKPERDAIEQLRKLFSEIHYNISITVHILMIYNKINDDPIKLFHNVNQSNACQPRLQDGTFECLSGVKREVSLSSLTVGYFGYIECLSAVSRHFVS